MTVYYKEVSSSPSIGPICTYFGKLLELFLLKRAKVVGCKPRFYARLCPKLSISPKYMYIAYYNSLLQGSVLILGGAITKDPQATLFGFRASF